MGRPPDLRLSGVGWREAWATGMYNRPALAKNCIVAPSHGCAKAGRGPFWASHRARVTGLLRLVLSD